MVKLPTYHFPFPNRRLSTRDCWDLCNGRLGFEELWKLYPAIIRQRRYRQEGTGQVFYMLYEVQTALDLYNVEYDSMK